MRTSRACFLAYLVATMRGVLPSIVFSFTAIEGCLKIAHVKWQILDVYPASRIRNFSVLDPKSASKNRSILTQKIVSKLSEMIRVVHPVSGSWFFTHPGSRGQKGTGYRIRNTATVDRPADVGPVLSPQGGYSCKDRTKLPCLATPVYPSVEVDIWGYRLNTVFVNRKFCGSTPT